MVLRDPGFQGETMSSLFTPETFGFFDGIAETPTKVFYAANKQAFKEAVEAPFRLLFRRIVDALPASITDVMDTKHDLFSRIPKNDFGRGGTWDYYWAALHLPDASRIESPQLYMWMNRDHLGLGFAFGTRRSDYEERFMQHLDDDEAELEELLSASFREAELMFGSREHAEPVADFGLWAADPAALGLRVVATIPKEQLLTMSLEELVAIGVNTFTRLFPFVLLATLESPMPAIRRYLEVPDSETPLDAEPAYSLAECAADTSIRSSPTWRSTSSTRPRRWTRSAGIRSGCSSKGRNAGVPRAGRTRDDYAARVRVVC